jgi:hypothetical protein
MRATKTHNAVSNLNNKHAYYCGLKIILSFLEDKYSGFQTCTNAEGECDASIGLSCQGDEEKLCL